MRKIFQLLLILIVIAKLVVFTVTHRNYFLRPFDPVYFGNLYSQSQYVIGQLSKGGIGDDGLYAFAGYYYFFQGGDVTKVNFEHPPLGKYLIGLSIFIFKNENIINLIYFIFLLYFVYRIGKIVLKDDLLSVLGVTILAFDPLFLDNLLRSLLDLPMALFLIIGFYFFLKGMNKPKDFYLASLFFGAAFSTRFFPFFVILDAYFFLIVLFFQRRNLKTFFTSSFLIPVIYLLTHLSFFIYNPSLLEFIRHKRWMLSWFTGSPVIMGNVWRNIFTGYYIDSTGKVAQNAYWTIVLPIVIILAISYWKVMKTKKQKLALFITYGMTIIYFIYVTVLTGGLQKFIMPIYPLIIILAVGHFSQLLYSIMKTWKKWISTG